MSFLRETEISSSRLLTALASLTLLFVLGFWTQSEPIPASIAVSVPLVLMLFGWSLFTGFRWLLCENDLRKFLGFKSDLPILPRNPDTMDYLRPIVAETMDEILNRILALKGRLSSAMSSKEFDACREAIRKERELYEKRRKLVRRFGFEVRSERKRLKSLRREGQAA